MSEVEAKVPTGNADVSATIIRACRDCGEKREIGTDCTSCGLTEPPEVIELGIIAAHRADPVEVAWWNIIGQRQADRRIRKANKAIKELCGERRSYDMDRG
jgi:hypothetical protein